VVAWLRDPDPTRGLIRPSWIGRIVSVQDLVWAAVARPQFRYASVGVGAGTSADGC